LIEEVKLRVNSGTQRLKLPFPALAITQALLEETLLKVLRKEEFDLRGTCEVTALSPFADRVEVRVARRERLEAGSYPGEEHWGLAESGSIHADFVIGADGRASHVRQALGIRTVTSGMERYAMFEFPSSPPAEPELAISHELCHLITPLSERRARGSFQLPRGQEWTADLELLGKLLHARAEQQAQPTELDWSEIMDFEPHVAEQFGRGRVWLAGDAAHRASPLGVQSMNRGLSEAWELTSEIAAVASGKRSLAALELLGNAQRKDWLQTLAVGPDFEGSLQAPGWLSGHAAQIVSALPVSGPDLEDLLRQLGIERRSYA